MRTKYEDLKRLSAVEAQTTHQEDHFHCAPVPPGPNSGDISSGGQCPPTQHGCAAHAYVKLSLTVAANLRSVATLPRETLMSEN